MRCNVDMLKIIQLGVTLSDENGHSPEISTWQFNFTFNLSCVLPPCRGETTPGLRSLMPA